MGGELCDAEALRRLRHDPEAITAVYNRHVARLVAALAHIGGDREAAFDLAQETFARLLEQGHRVRLVDGESAWPWLWTVGRNLLRDWQRRAAVDAKARHRLRIATIPYDEGAVDDLIARVDAQELRDLLAEALSELPSDQRRAVVARAVTTHDYGRLASVTGASRQVLRSRVSRGLRALRLRMSGGKP